MNIGIIGLGMVGVAIQEGFEQLTHNVFTHDIKLNTEISNLIQTDVIFICVPTPQMENNSCDVSIVESVVLQLSDLNYKGVVCIKSTVEPGTTRKLLIEYPNLIITHVPEFLREKHALVDFTLNHNLLAIGADGDYEYNIIKEAHGHYPKNTVKITPEEAELVKYYSNVYKATRVTFANSFARVCNHLNVDYEKVKDTFLLHGVTEPEYLSVTDEFGGFGGSCLPKDVNAFNSLIKKHNLDINLFDCIIDENKKYQ
jgi:UDPglucose 6-dehydrogenase